jgi:hypothetical protein
MSGPHRAGSATRPDFYKVTIGERLVASIPYFLILASGLAIALVERATDSTWHLSDGISLLFGILFSFALVFIGRRQGNLQEALSNLEMREKIGVIEASALRSKNNTDSLWCLYVASDARAALYLFPLASEAVREDFLYAVKRAFDAILASGVVERLDADQFEVVAVGVQHLKNEITDLVNQEYQLGLDAVKRVGELERRMDELTRERVVRQQANKGR